MPPPVTDATVRAEHARVRRLARETPDVVYVGCRTGQFAVRFSRSRDGVRRVALTRVDVERDGDALDADAGFDDALDVGDAIDDELDAGDAIDDELDAGDAIDDALDAGDAFDDALDVGDAINDELDAGDAFDAPLSRYHCVVRAASDADDPRRVEFHHPFPALEWLNETVPAFDLLEFVYVNAGDGSDETGAESTREP